MSRNMTRNISCLFAGLALVVWISACRVNVQKGANGEDKNVQVDTPFGGVHVDTNSTTAADLGLPVYPGAKVVKDDDNHKSADVHLGFGEWQLRVRVVSYSSPDQQDKVEAYYKNALGRYGAVLTCQGNVAVGTPTQTPEGLTCSNDHKHTNVDVGSGLQLKAGSKSHQHIVGFDQPKDGQTRFALIALDLPANMEGSASSD
ncbi:MAG: hypothetical protein WBD67_07315 [Terracidiphilus sp.]